MGTFKPKEYRKGVVFSQKRENRNGKYYLVGRYWESKEKQTKTKGKILSYTKWTPKTSETKKRLFKQNKSYNKNTRIEFLSNVRETSFKNYRSNIKTKKKAFQITAVGQHKGEKIIARSTLKRGQSKKEALAEAEENFIKLYGFQEFKTSSTSRSYRKKVKESYEKEQPKIRYGIVYYSE